MMQRQRQSPERNVEAVIGQGEGSTRSGCSLPYLENQLGALCLPQKWNRQTVNWRRGY